MIKNIKLLIFNQSFKDIRDACQILITFNYHFILDL